MATRQNITEITNLAKALATKELNDPAKITQSKEMVELLGQVTDLLKQKSRGDEAIESLVSQVEELIKQKSD
jgi:hypothetical protein